MNGADVTDVAVACATEPPAVGLSAGALDFGFVPSGDTSSRSVTITNTGSGELVISDLIEPEGAVLDQRRQLDRVASNPAAG